MPALIIITGPPCAGKTTLSKKIAQEFGWICLSRDWFKELLFERLGWSNVQWFDKIGLVSLDLLYFVCSLLMFAKQTFVVDSTFDSAAARRRFAQLKNKYHYHIIEINCLAAGQVLYDRYLKRAPSRHPGYIDKMRWEELKARLLSGRTEPLGLGKVIELDSTSFHKIQHRVLFQEITRSLKTPHRIRAVHA